MSTNSIEEEVDHVLVVEKTGQEVDQAEEEEEEEPEPQINIFQETIVEGKRKRKSLEAFLPEDFKDESQKNTFANLVIKQGQGEPLGHIPDIRTKIEQASQNDPIMEAAHKFLYGGIGGAKGAVVKKLIKSQLLEFSGYVPINADHPSCNHSSIKAVEEKLTEDMTAKAYRMTVPLLKSICDFFCLDRSGQMDKEQLVERILEFLRAPSIKGTKNGKLTSRKRSMDKESSEPRLVKKAKVVNDEKAVEDDTEDEHEEKPSLDKEAPTDDMLRTWVKAYCACFNLDKVTTKHAIETASDKFGVDLSSMKEKIRGFLAEEIKAMNA